METIIVVAALCISLVFFVRRTRRPPLPPGPKSPWFGFGQPSVPASYPWKTYEEWRKIYGDIVFYYAFGNPVAIINSRKVADDLLEKRGAIYSSRPSRTMMRDLMGWSWSFGGMPYGESWRKYRGTFQKHFRSRTVARYEPIQLKEVQTLLLNLSRSPEEYLHHMRRNAAAIVMKINYDHDIAEEGDIYVDLAEKAMESVAQAAIHGTFVVDYVPILKYVPSWFPGAQFKRQAKEWRKLSDAMLQKPFEMVKQKMASGTAGPCVTTLEIEEAAHEEDVDVTMTQGVAAVSYAAGADTTVAAVISFFFAMMTHPEIQRRAQEEIDRVVGTDRLPTFEDRSRLPFVTCISWEILRWNPIAPLGVAHATVQDDVYEGHWIPKGTSLIPNIWRMFHDETKYPNPSQFDPQRFADEARNTALGINELPLMTFGFGRRICPGRWLALDTIWITIASVLAVYNISKPKDGNGVDIEQSVKFTGVAISRPEPFKCLFIPRSKEALALITKGDGQTVA